MTPLSLAVVGHTNTGKTSLMRTLLRDSQFGEVKNAAATTRHVEEATIGDGQSTWVKLYDTPGLEDAGGLLDWLEQHTSAKKDGIERVEFFLHHDIAQQEFSQEAKVLRQLLASDIALYVIDAREPVLPRYKDELAILSWCAKPIMPVFNFTQNQNIDAWANMLSRQSLHVMSSFDTVAFDFKSELNLWGKLSTMLPEENTLGALMAQRHQEWQQLDNQARLTIAHFLLDCAAATRSVQAHENQAPFLHDLQTHIRQLEHALQQQLLYQYRFYTEHTNRLDWAINAFCQDPFDGDLLKDYGIRTTKGAATGALIGLGLDALTLGTSLGAATALGGLIGGIASNWQNLSDKINGRQNLYIDNATLTLLAARACDFLHVLQHRGHAAQNHIIFQEHRLPWRADKIPPVLQSARRQATWSTLNTPTVSHAEQARQAAAMELSTYLHIDELPSHQNAA